jgi:hypothetical protein
MVVAGRNKLAARTQDRVDGDGGRVD